MRGNSIVLLKSYLKNKMEYIENNEQITKMLPIKLVYFKALCKGFSVSGNDLFCSDSKLLYGMLMMLFCYALIKLTMG